MDIGLLTEYFGRYGFVAIFVMVLLEYMNLPGFPAGVIMPLSGIMAAHGNIGFGSVILVTVAAGLAGSLLLYVIGRIGGHLFLNAYFRRFPKQQKTIEKNMKWLQERGYAGVFIAKLLPMVRTIISIPAGILQLNPWKYIVSSTLGIFLWNLVFVGAGYLLGDRVFALL